LKHLGKFFHQIFVELVQVGGVNSQPPHLRYGKLLSTPGKNFNIVLIPRILFEVADIFV
jgi:hypothetical protein